MLIKMRFNNRNKEDREVNSKSTMIFGFVLIVLASILIGTGCCRKDTEPGAAEKAGTALDKAAEDVINKTSELLDKAGEELTEVGEEIDESLSETSNP